MCESDPDDDRISCGEGIMKASVAAPRSCGPFRPDRLTVAAAATAADDDKLRAVCGRKDDDEPALDDAPPKPEKTEVF